MAKEAILKIKEAEESATEKVKKAVEQSKEINRAAEIDGNEKQKEIIKGAYAEKEAMIEQAKNQAVSESAAVVAAGKGEIDNILNPATDKKEKAIKLVMERIVSGNGYS